MRTVGLVLNPERDSAEAAGAVLGWAGRRDVEVLGSKDEIRRLNCAALPVTPAELGSRSDLLVSLGGDGTMLRAMRLAVEVDGHVAGYAGPGDRICLQPRPGAARVIRLGQPTFCQQARRKLRITDSAEIAWPAS